MTFLCKKRELIMKLDISPKLFVELKKTPHSFCNLIEIIFLTKHKPLL